MQMGLIVDGFDKELGQGVATIVLFYDFTRVTAELVFPIT